MSIPNLFRAALVVYVGTFAAPSNADQVINDDLIVFGDLCVGASCTDNMDFGWATVVIDGVDPSILFTDTSNSASFPTTDWNVGVDSSTGSFIIRNADTSQTVFTITADGTGVAIGAGATLTNGVVSLGGLRVANVANGIVNTDAITLGQLNAAIATLPADLRAANATSATINAQNTAINAQNTATNATNMVINAANIATNASNVARLDELSQEINAVGAIGSAMSALQVNQRGGGDHSVSFGLGNYQGTTALALGSFHYFADNRIFVNTGIARATNGVGGTAARLGVTFGR